MERFIIDLNSLLFKDKQDAVHTFMATLDQAGKAFWETGNGDFFQRNSPQRQVDLLSDGLQSVFALADQVHQLQFGQMVKGKGMSPELTERLQEICLGDLTSAGAGDIGRLLLKLLLDEEVQSLGRHGECILEAGKVVEDLLLSQPRHLLEHLLAVSSVTARQEAREISHETGLEDLTDSIVREERKYIAGGSFGDVFEAVLIRRGNAKTKVAVKVVRVYQDYMNDPAKKSRIERRLRREIRVWNKLQHLNVVPLLGFVRSFQTGFYTSPLLSMVCPWMAGGTLTSHLCTRHQELTLRDRFQLITDIIEGLSYLHSKSVIHGDLTSANVLISENTASLSDFGLSQIISEFAGASYKSSRVGGAMRWRAPELVVLDGPVPEITKACDIYSFGCIVHEVISGRLPYFNQPNALMVQLSKSEGTPPPRPECNLLTNQLWEFMQLCWRDDPGWRPDATQASRKLQNINSGYSNEALNDTLPPIVEEVKLEEDRD